MPIPSSDSGLPGRGSSSNVATGSKTTRIDFSPSLDSIDPKCPQSPVANHDVSAWDTETDHILSYFLGGDVHVASHDEPGFTSGRHPVGHDSSKSSGRDEDSEAAYLPPTPAVQFYSHDNRRTSQHHNYFKNTTSNSVGKGKIDDSNLNNELNTHMANHTVVDNLSSISYASNNGSSQAFHVSYVTQTQQQHIYQQLYHRRDNNSQDNHSNRSHNYGSENPSPISPAVMIGLANENLLLPLASPLRCYKSETSKVTLASTNTQSSATGNPAPSSSALVGIFDSNNESRILPPEKLLEVFPSHTQSSALHNNQVYETPSTISQIGNPTGSIAVAQPQHQQHFTKPAAIPPPDQNLGPYPQHFIYSHHPDFAAAILNRHHALLNSNPVPLVESEEKKAKRLERNRESARKSRRKKKERLLTLGGQVKKLQDQIEIERRKHINSMVPVMNKLRLEDIHLFRQRIWEGEYAHADLSDRTCVVIQQSGPNSRIMRSVLDFQYTTLKQLTLPSYQKMLLWFTVLEENFFLAGKEEYSKRALAANSTSATKQPSKNSTTSSLSKNVSSKQIGEELFNGTKEENGAKGKKKRDKDNDGGDRPNVTAAAFDASLTWPLLSFELRLSVDQEERFLATHKHLRQSNLLKYRLVDGKKADTLENHRSQVVAAFNTAESLSKAVGSLSHVISRREDATLARVLKIDQLAAFLVWLDNSNNRSRCRNRMGLNALSQEFSSGPHGATSTTIDMDTGVASATSSKEASLQDICRRLNKVLHISPK